MALTWPICVLLGFWFSHPAQSQKTPPGLSCVNDYVNNVSCTWNHSWPNVGVDCWVLAAKNTWTRSGFDRHHRLMIRSCKLKRLGSPVPHCSFVFENKEFSTFEVLPSIWVECNYVQVENLTNYAPCDHIKMHPPSTPNVSTSPNETWILWSPGSPRSYYFKEFEFQLQIKQSHQQWKEASLLYTQDQELRIVASGRKPGNYQVRVRVKPPVPYTNPHWSDWSPITSWIRERRSTLEHQVSFLVLALSLVVIFIFVIIILLVLLRSRISRQLFKGKPVPDPSEYFKSLHSGNLKKWLNPQSADKYFFTTPHCDSVSRVEVSSDFWYKDGATSPSSCGAISTSTSALLHPHPDHLSSSGPVSSTYFSCSSSSPSSCFSNLGHFKSASTPPPSLADPCPVFLIPRSHCLGPALDDWTPQLQLRPCPPGARQLSEPQSPDSGFGVGLEEQGLAEEKAFGRLSEEEYGEVASGKPPNVLFLVHHHHHQHSSQTSCLPSPPNPDDGGGDDADNSGPEAPALLDGVSYAAWPLGRCSSMPVEPCNTGYLSVKELQTHCSNKSI